MRTTEERIEQLHRRAHEIKRESDKRAVRGWGGVSAALFVVLLVVTANLTGGMELADGSGLTGSSLLGESAGGYVLAAVIAFFVGAIITAVIYKRRRR